MRKKETKREGGEKKIAIFISIFFLLLFLSTQSISIFGGDGGDLVAAAFVRGVAHPPGYPLYTFLGWLLTHIPYSTIAWRVGLLSSIPMAVAIGILFLLIFHFTKNSLTSVIAAGAYGSTYLFWLYSVVPEVFGLHILFSVTLIYLAVKFAESANLKYWYWFVFILGLSFTHHQTIVLLLPGLVYLLYFKVKQISTDKSVISFSAKVFGLSLLPYIYVVLASWTDPIINWENPHAFAGFIRLVTRAAYGTFRSGKAFGLQHFDRLLQFKLFWESLLIDTTKAGLFLGGLGLVSLLRKQRRYFWFLSLCFFTSGPLFVFYAGFPAFLNFYLGTSERFLLLPYLILYIFIGLGIAESSRLIKSFLSTLLKRNIRVPVEFIFLLMPVMLLVTNYPKLKPLQKDLTAEYLAEDILASAPDNALLLLTDDTSVFNTEYVYLTQGAKSRWNNKKIIKLGLVYYPFYSGTLRRHYPEIDIQGIEETENIYKLLVDNNYQKFPIVASGALNVGDEYIWVPQGLLFRLYKKSDYQLELSHFKAVNATLLLKFHDPLGGALKTYTHPLLADVLRVYGNGVRSIGKVLLSLQDFAESEKMFLEAVRYQPEAPHNTLALAESYLIQKKCAAALSTLKSATEKFSENPEVYRLMYLQQLACGDNARETEKYLKLYEEKLKDSQTRLDDY